MRNLTNSSFFSFHLFFLFALFPGSFLIAQTKELNGIVKNEMGEPLSGVTIQVGEDLNHGTITNSSGKFELSNVKTGDNIIFSFIGYEGQKFKYNGEPSITVILRSLENQLDSIVVIGYGQVRKRDLTGSVASIGKDELQAFPNATVSQALLGRASGVQVQQNAAQPGSPIQIRIRGANSIRGNNDPLWIIDGFPGTPDALNINDIDNIEVLKDASATAIYGSRGANGVIIVTTKTGRAGANIVEYNGRYSIQSIRKKLDLLNSQEYMSLMNTQQINDTGESFFSDEQIKNAEETDWQNLLMRKGGIIDQSISFYGGSEKTRFAISPGIFLQQGIMKKNNFEKINLLGSINHEISEKIKVSMRVILNNSENENSYPNTGLRGNSLISAMIGAPPTVNAYLGDGTYRLLNTTYPFVSDGLINPVAYINENTIKEEQKFALVNVGLVFKPVKEFSFSLGGNITDIEGRSDSYTTTKYPGSIGTASILIGSSTEFNGSAIAEYNRTFWQKHKVTITAGTTTDIYLSRPLSLSGKGFLSDIFQTDNIGAASTIGTPSSSYSRWAILSFLGRVNYAFADKILATFSLRADGSSRYSENDKWGYFPSGALAYRVVNGNSKNKIGPIDDLKFRVGYGETGSTAIDPYYTLNMLNNSKVVFNDDLFNSVAPGTRMPAPLKWETTVQTNIGADLGIIDNKIRITVDYYIKKTRNLLNSVQLPSSTGYVNTIQNIGEVQNVGFEFMVDALPINSDKFKWHLNTNFSLNKNKVLKLYNGQDILGDRLDITILGDNLNLIREGQPMSIFYGYVEDGYTDGGQIKYKDLDGNGIITPDDKTYIGNPNPKFFYGLNTDLSYKSFSISAFIQGVQGVDIYALGMAAQTLDYGQGLNTLREVLLSNWSPQNTNAEYPKISRLTSTLMSDRFVKNGSFMRLKNIQIAYNFSHPIFGGNMIKRLQLYLSGQNLLTLTNYPWYDPDVNTKGGGGSIAQGIDHYAYPAAKSITVGTKITF